MLCSRPAMMRKFKTEREHASPLGTSMVAQCVPNQTCSSLSFVLRGTRFSQSALASVWGQDLVERAANRHRYGAKFLTPGGMSLLHRKQEHHRDRCPPRSRYTSRAGTEGSTPDSRSLTRIVLRTLLYEYAFQLPQSLLRSKLRSLSAASQKVTSQTYCLSNFYGLWLAGVEEARIRKVAYPDELGLGCVRLEPDGADVALVRARGHLGQFRTQKLV